MSRVRLVGRTGSHFTRVAAIFAHELGVPLEMVVVHELLSLDAGAYGGHPALKLPTLVVDGSALFGTENICRRLAELSGRAGDPRVVFPEHVTADVGRCAQELVWHAMAAQVQLVVGRIAGLPGANAFLDKAAVGLCGALAWLDERLDEVEALLPAERDLSIFEVTSFCLVEHLAFRPTVPIEPYPALCGFASAFARRPSARRTAYRIAPTTVRPPEPA